MNVFCRFFTILNMVRLATLNKKLQQVIGKKKYDMTFSFC